MQAFYGRPPAHVNAGKKPWALLFNPDACKEKYADTSLKDMVIKDALLQNQAMMISELRERLRVSASTVAR